MNLVYFAWVRQKIGKGEESFTPPGNVSTVGQLIDALAARGPNYAEAFRDPKRLCCAVNQAYVGFDAPVKSTDEIAFFPPVTGG